MTVEIFDATQLPKRRCFTKFNLAPGRGDWALQATFVEFVLALVRDTR
jgi:hypothetical protein